jgi:hypothetical protein
VRLHRKALPKDPRPKTLRLKYGDIRIRTWVDLAVVWRDKRDVCLLTVVHSPPREDNYCNELGNVIKPPIVADYNCLMGHVDNSDRMASSYIACHRNMEVDKKKLFFNLLDLAIVNSYILLSSCGGKKFSHTDF